MAQLKVTLVKSPIGSPDKVKGALVALGCTKMHKTVVKEDNASIRGMIHRVAHLVKVEEC